MTRKTIILSLLVVAALAVNAQDDRPTFEEYSQAKQQAFNQHLRQRGQSFDSIRRQANERFAAKMAEAWTLFDMTPAETEPQMPEPDKPRVKDDDTPQPVKPVKPNETIIPPMLDKDKPNPTPAPTEPEKPKPTAKWLSFSYYNTPCKVRVDNSLRIKLRDVDEKTVAQAWKQLSGEASEVLVADFIRLIAEMRLCDWAVLDVFRTFSEKFLGKDSNEAVLMQVYLLAQTGHKARIGRIGNSLVMLAPFAEKVYAYTYYNIDGMEFYNLTGERAGNGCFIYDMSFPGEQLMSLRPYPLPLFAESPTALRELGSTTFPEMKAAVKANRNLVDFLAAYPHCRWENYVYAGLSEEVMKSLYPALHSALKGKPLHEAADMLLNFMHEAFDYKTDHAQFGYERTLFADEMFFYHYSDCEDRAVLYTILVRDLLGLDAALLVYPDHVATAIALPENVEGSYILVNGKRYLMCDPTYIGSHIGDVASNFRNIEPKVIVIK